MMMMMIAPVTMTDRQNHVGRYDKLIFVKEISEPGSFCQEAVEDYLVVEMALLGGALLPCHNYIR